MAIAVSSTASITGDKVAAASKTVSVASSWGVTGGELQVLIFGWKGSASGQTISLGTITSGSNVVDGTILAQRESTGTSGIAVILLRLRPGANPSIQGVGTNVTISVNTGTITAWGADSMVITGTSPETAVAWVGADNTTLTTTTPTVTSGSASIGDLVIGVMSLAGPTGDTFTQDADTTNGSWVTIGSATTPGGTSGAAATTNQTVRGAYKITTTAAGTQTYNPTLGTARNYAALIGALRAYTVVSGTDTTPTSTQASKLGILATDGRNAGTTSGVHASSQSVVGTGIAWSTPANAVGAADSASAGLSLAASDISQQLELAISLGLASGAQLTAIHVTFRNANFSGGAAVAWPIFRCNVLDNTLTYNVPMYINEATAQTDQNVSTLMDFTYHLTGTTQASLDTLNQGDVTNIFIDVTGYNPDTNPHLLSLDAVDVSVDYLIPATTFTATESASVSIGGGTPKSGTDTNGATTETTAPIAAEIGTDANGATTDVTALAAQAPDTDANSTVTESFSIAVPVPASDTNSATTEITVEVAKPSSADTNSTTTEAVNEVFPASSADTNSATTEAVAEAGKPTDTDSNSAVTEAGSIAVPIAASDVNSVTTENTSSVAQETATDANAATTETGIETAAPAVTDSNSTTTESSGEIAGSSGTDTGGSTDAPVEIAAISDTDGGTSSESASTTVIDPSGTKATPVGSVSLSSVTNPTDLSQVYLHVRTRKRNVADVGVLRVWLYEGATLREGPYDISLTTAFVTDQHSVANAATIGSWSNLRVEFQGVAGAGANLTPDISYIDLQSPQPTVTTTPKSGTDSNGTTTEAVSFSASEIAPDTGTSAETGVEVAKTSTPDANTVTTENAALVAPAAGTDSGTSAEAATIVIRLTLTDANAGTTEITVTGSILSALDANGTTTEATIQAITVPDAGTVSETPSLVNRETATDANGATAEIGGTGTIKSGVDSSGPTTESTASVASGAVSDSGGSTDATGVLGRYTAPDASAGVLEALTELARATSGDTSGPTVENQSFSYITTSSDQGISVETTLFGLKASDLATAFESGSISGITITVGDVGIGIDTEVAFRGGFAGIIHQILSAAVENAVLVGAGDLAAVLESVIAFAAVLLQVSSTSEAPGIETANASKPTLTKVGF